MRCVLVVSSPQVEGRQTLRHPGLGVYSCYSKLVRTSRSNLKEAAAVLAVVRWLSSLRTDADISVFTSYTNQVRQCTGKQRSWKDFWSL